MNNKYITINEAARIFNTETSNIRYLLDYHSDKIHRYNSLGELQINGMRSTVYVSIQEIQEYYNARKQQSLDDAKNLGETNLEIQFRDLSDSERTKHVHGLHPYMGKFIPQLAEYYLNKYFKAKEIILDPFGGSGTTLVEANILGIESIGIDIAQFNTILMNAKLMNYQIPLFEFEVLHILDKVARFSSKNWQDKDAKKGFLTESQIAKYKKLLYKKERSIFSYFDEDTQIHSNEFNYLFSSNCNIPSMNDFAEPKSEYLAQWLAPRTNTEVNYYASLIPNYYYQDILKVILSAAIRSSRLIKHSDLTRPTIPLKPGEEYVCRKHRNRICKPIDQGLKWLRLHSISKKGVINRVNKFSKIRTNTQYHVFHGDSTNIDLGRNLNQDSAFIKGVFTSPPYLGLINYHEQHRYAYDILNLPMLKDAEIGSAELGKSKNAAIKYKQLISKVLINIKPFLLDNADVFIVANDNNSLYSDIFAMSEYTLISTDIRGVYKRADGGGAKSNYAESIFHIKPY